MGIARYLSKLASGLSSEGVVSAAKGGTGSTSGATGGGGPKITAITVTNSSYTNLDDTAVDVAGGYIKLTGSGFASGCQVLVGSTPATSTTFVSSTEVRAQVPATTAGTYIVYLVNSDGGVAIRVNGITFSTTPTWTTGSGLSAPVNSQISIQLAATGASTFSVASGSSLPSGVSLSSSGLLSGSITGLTSPTTYTFTILATDTELQDSPQTFSFSISVGEPYFKYTTLLLSADGTNAAQNNTFLDSSTNNFTITRNGNTTQGTFSPYGGNWSNYFDGTGDYLTLPASSAFTFGTGDFTIEGWAYMTAVQTTASGIFQQGTSFPVASTTNTVAFGTVSSGQVWQIYANGTNTNSTTTWTLNTWYHFAVVRSSGTTKLYINGVAVITVASDNTNYTGTYFGIGAIYNTTFSQIGYISNVRVVKGTAIYTGNFTSPTTPLTPITNTSLLTCQSNRFIDNSTNAFTITTSGSPTIQRFSPFSPGAAYSATTIGGSAYFDGTGDYLTVADSALTEPGSGNFTLECWYYMNSSTGYLIGKRNSASANYGVFQIAVYPSGGSILGVLQGGGPWDLNLGFTATTPLYTWNHLAFVRSGNVYTVYINGVSSGTTTLAGTLNNSNYDWVVGAYQSDGTGAFSGYISNMRLVIGTAVYTSNFTPPSAPISAIANTQLLLNFTNAGIIDSAMMNNVETAGDAKISTTQSKFGGSSIYFDGTGDYISCPESLGQKFGAGNLTWEMWINTASTTQYATLYSRTPASWATGMWSWLMNHANLTAGDLALYIADYNLSTPLLLTTGVNIRDSAWHHIAVVRNGSSWALYVDGTSRATATWAGALVDIAGSPYIGADQFYGRAFTGYIDDFRITKGYARYTANFTPPTLAHSAQ